MIDSMTTIYDRFLSDYTSLGHREPNPDFEMDCLIWDHGTNGHASWNDFKGYGSLKVNGKESKVHRLVYHLLVDQSFPIRGKIGAIDIDHLCRVTNCYEPTHLIPESHRANVVKGRRCVLNTEMTSQHVGVTWDKQMNQWRAQITIEGKHYNLGLFRNEENASQAYQAALLWGTIPAKRVTSSQYRGVSWSKRHSRWRSEIRINGKKFHLGYFVNEEDAAQAYQHALSIKNKGDSDV